MQHGLRLWRRQRGDGWSLGFLKPQCFCPTLVTAHEVLRTGGIRHPGMVLVRDEPFPRSASAIEVDRMLCSRGLKMWRHNEDVWWVGRIWPDARFTSLDAIIEVLATENPWFLNEE